MKFPSGFLDEIRARLPVTAVVGQRVKLKKQGREWRGLSPFQAEKTPSFYVNDQKGFYHCFSSGKHGDIFRFLMEVEGLSFPEAVERCASLAGLTMPALSSEDVRQEQHRAGLHEVMALAMDFFQKRLQSREGAAARGYLADRGLSPAIQAEFSLGFATGERFALRDHLAGKGINRDQMIEAGLLISGDDIPVPYDRFRDRIIFPIHSASGKIIAFGGRAMAREASAKYLNSPETPLFHKGACLYNHHRARKAAQHGGSIIVVEGYIDVIMMSAAGFTSTVAPLGTALTEEQLNMLWRLNEEPVLCFDGDRAGRRAAYRAIDVALPHISAGRTLKFALLPSGQDPDDLIRNSGAGAMREVLTGAQALSDLLWTRETESGDFSTPERRAALERRLMEVLAPIRDETVRKHYRSAMDSRLRAFFGATRSPGPAFSSRARGEWRKDISGSSTLPVSSDIRQTAIFRGSKSTLPAREALILAALVNHPFLLDRHFEDVGRLEFDNDEANRLRQSLVDCTAEGLRESPDIEMRLHAMGFERLLHDIRSKSVPLHPWLLADSPFHEVEDRFQRVVTLHHRFRTLNKELKLAASILEQDYTPDNFARLTDIKAQIAAMAGMEASIDGV